MADIRNILFIVALVFWSMYALVKEYREHDDCFRTHGPKKGESIYRSTRKLEKCVNYDLHTIKWRRILICSGIAVVLLFVLVHARVPSTKELVLHLLLIFVVFYLSWQNYGSRTSKKAIGFTIEHIANIKEKIRTKHTFILPSTFT